MLEMLCAGDIQMRGGLLEVVLVPKQQQVRSDWPTVGMLAKASKTPFGVASHTHHYVSDIIGDNRPIGIPEQVRLDMT